MYCVHILSPFLKISIWVVELEKDKMDTSRVKEESHGIEPTFLKLDLWSPGVGCIPILTSNAMY